MQQEVLHKNSTDSTFTFGKWKESGDTETRLRYLGTLNTKEDKVKVITSIWLWGLSCRATSRIILYDSSNNYLGNYYVGMAYDLPSDIENSLLVFTYSDTEECDAVSKIDFAEGIPKQFFLECKNGMGDIFEFDAVKR